MTSKKISYDIDSISIEMHSRANRYEVSMASTMVHIRVDEKLKQEACAALEDMGLSLSDAVRLLLVRVAAEKALPFEIRVPNKSTIYAMEEVKSGKMETFASIASLMANLDEND